MRNPAPEFAAPFAVGDRAGATGACPTRWVAVIFLTVHYPAPSWEGALGAKVRSVARDIARSSMMPVVAARRVAMVAIWPRPGSRGERRELDPRLDCQYFDTIPFK
jgi:hypothetical protein